MRKSNLQLDITLDDNNLPHEIIWTSHDGQNTESKNCKSMFLSMWDGEDQNTMRIDLWTKDMQIDEMHTHFFQMLLSIGDSYKRATNNPYIQEDIKNFCMELADKTRAWEEGKAKS